ncbi:Uncharacterised protein [Mycobacterium tuberculosis]|nr:Uncharacterised protein [Mycobacterium tuberculosis]
MPAHQDRGSAGIHLRHRQPDDIARASVRRFRIHRHRRRREHRDCLMPSRQILDRGAVPVGAGLGAQRAVRTNGPIDQVDSGDTGSETTARCGKHIGNRADLGDRAGLEHQYPVGQREHVQQVMGRQDYRATAPRDDTTQHRTDTRGRGHIESGQRLVEQQHIRFGRQRSRDGDALGLAPG